MKYAPTYIASIVSIIIAFQGMIGLDFTPDAWTYFLIILIGIFNAGRQLITGRSTFAGTRPDEFEG